MSSLPCVLQPKFENIPPQLRQLPQWVVWREVIRDGRPTKVPFNAATGHRAAADNPATWSTFEAAFAAYQRGGHTGFGFMFSGSDGFCGVDLDHCRDPETGAIAEWAAEIIRKLDPYAEISPSGTGVKLFLKATKPGDRCKTTIDKATGAAVELYDHGRYFTITGHHLNSTPLGVEPRQEALNALYGNLFSAKSEQPSSVSPVTPTALAQPSAPPAPFNAEDDNLLSRAFSATNGEKFRQLWNGILTGHGSHSEADLALCSHLAFWTRGDADQIDRLFRKSGLYREKWQRADYRSATITKSIQGLTASYDAHHRAQPESTPALVPVMDDSFWDACGIRQILANPVTWAPVEYVPAGLHALDAAVGGGLRVGGVHLVVGKSGRAKTQTCVQILANAAAIGVPVGMVSLEMDRSEVAHLLVSQASGLPRSWIDHGDIRSPNNLESLRQAVQTMALWPMKILDDAAWEGGLTRRRLETLIGMGCKRFGWRLVLVDYTGLIAKETEDATDFAADVALATTLKRIARRNKIALVVVSALRKAANLKKTNKQMDTPATLDDVIGAGRIVYDCFNCLYVDCRQQLDYKRSLVGNVLVYPLKRRFSGGDSGQSPITLDWHPSCGRVTSGGAASGIFPPVYEGEPARPPATPSDNGESGPRIARGDSNEAPDDENAEENDE